MAKLAKQNWYRNDFLLKITPGDINVGDEFNQSLSYLVAFDPVNETNRLVTTDNNGRLQVSTAAGKTDQVAQSSVVVTNVSGVLVSYNSERIQVILYNAGTQNVYLQYGDVATVANSMVLPPGGYLIEDVFIGTIQAIVAAGTATIKLIEM